VTEFVRRFCLHLLPERFVKIRHYGLLSNRNRQERIARVRQALGVNPVPAGEPSPPAMTLTEAKSPATMPLLRGDGVGLVRRAATPTPHFSSDDRRYLMNPVAFNRPTDRSERTDLPSTSPSCTPRSPAARKGDAGVISGSFRARWLPSHRVELPVNRGFRQYAKRRKQPVGPYFHI
jgi:hypothetical protein